MLLTKRWRQSNDANATKSPTQQTTKTFYLSGGYYYETGKNTL